MQWIHIHAQLIQCSILGVVSSVQVYKCCLYNTALPVHFTIKCSAVSPLPCIASVLYNAVYTSKSVHCIVSHGAGIQQIGSCTKSQGSYGAPLVQGGESRPVSGTDRVGLFILVGKNQIWFQFFFCFYKINIFFLFFKNRPLADSFIESQCPFICVFVCPFSCDFFWGLSLALRSHDQIPASH